MSDLLIQLTIVSVVGFAAGFAVGFAVGYIFRLSQDNKGTYAKMKREFDEQHKKGACQHRQVAGEDAMSEKRAAPTIWLASELEAEMAEKWKSMTVKEIQEVKHQAERKMEAILAELYRETGMVFTVSNSQMYRTDALNSLTRWTVQESFLVTLKGNI